MIDIYVSHRILKCTARLASGERAEVRITGAGAESAAGLALWLCDDGRRPVAAAPSLAPGPDGALTCLLNLATVEMDALVAGVPAGRALTLWTVLGDMATGEVLAAGRVSVCASWMPDDLEDLGDLADPVARMGDLAPAFDATASYEAGDVVCEGGALYVFTAAHSGPWDEADAERTTLAEQLGQGGAVESVNGMTGDVVLGAHDVGALSMEEAVAGYTDWACAPATYGGDPITLVYNGDAPGWEPWAGGEQIASAAGDAGSTSLTFPDAPVALSATRTRLRPTAAQEAAWDGKQAALTAQQLANIAAVPGKADSADLRYAVSTEPLLPDSSGVVALADRAVNLVALTETIATLTLNFPAPVSGRTRDFLVRIDAASGVPAPEIALPVGVVAENADGDIPAIATTTEVGATAVTLLYFSETVAGRFLVKGEEVKAVANE